MSSVTYSVNDSPVSLHSPWANTSLIIWLLYADSNTVVHRLRDSKNIASYYLFASLWL